MVVTAVAPIEQKDASINLFNLAMSNKEVKGTIFGSLSPRVTTSPACSICTAAAR